MKSIHDDRYHRMIKHLIACREQRKVTQEVLATQLGRVQSFVAKVENLDRRLDVVELADWLKVLNISLFEFLAEFDWAKLDTENLSS